MQIRPPFLLTALLAAFASAASAQPNDAETSQAAQSAKYTPPQAICLPLDSRPCNRLFPAQMARIGGGELLMPDTFYLGKAYTPGNTEKLAQWLLAQPIASDAIISADMLAYGGLIASRTAETSEEQALQNLQVLQTLCDKGQKLEVLVTLPRLSLRTSDRQAPYEAALKNWATSGSLDKLPNVPEDIFNEYMQVRRRNFNVVCHLIDLAAQGTLQKLVIGLDDSAHNKGLHIEERARLNKYIAEKKAASRVVFLSGADELTCCMTAGWLSRVNNYNPRLELIYSDPKAADTIPLLENSTLKETVEMHMALSGAIPAEGTGTALFIETPSDKPYAVPVQEGTAETKALAENLLKRIETLKSVRSDRPYGIADLRLVNRAEPIFAQTVIDKLPIWELSAYSAWNTPSNSLGTAIAQACVQQIGIVRGSGWDAYSRLESEKTQQAFTVARLIDDYAYQAVIRQELKQDYNNIDMRSDPLLNAAGPAGLKARSLAIPWAQNLWRDKLENKSYYSRIVADCVYFDSMQLEIVLPWPRLFEIEERLNLTVLPYKDKPSAGQKAPKAENKFAKES
ncbi:DUF4127 family protein [bacterium]|nr:DUF4127 family protein [bacterium]